MPQVTNASRHALDRLKLISIVLLVLLFSFSAAHAQQTAPPQNDGQGELKIITSNETEKDSGVWIDGEYIGYLRDFWGNKKILLAPGEHEVTVRKFGYKDFTQKVAAEAGKDYLMVTMLQLDVTTQYPVQNTADIRLNVNPDEAAVLVDGAYVGYAGQFMGLSKYLTMTAGQHRIRVEMQGYRPYETQFNAVAGRSSEFKAALSKGGPELDGPPRIIQSIIKEGATSLQLPAGRIYLYGMAVGGKGPSTSFSLGQYATVFHEEEYLAAAVAYGSNSQNTYNTQTDKHIIGGVSVGGAWQTLRTFYGSNSAGGAKEAPAVFTVDQDSLVVVLGLSSSEQQIALDGLPGLQVDATHSGPAASASMIIAHAVLRPGMYRVVEHTSDVVKNVSPDAAADLIAVFVFGAKTLSTQ